MRILFITFEDIALAVKLCSLILLPCYLALLVIGLPVQYPDKPQISDCRFYGKRDSRMQDAIFDFSAAARM